MCEIIHVKRIGDQTLIDCSPYVGDFLNAGVLNIRDRKGHLFGTTNFKVAKSRACFSEGGSPWIMTTAKIPDNYLQKGNEISFVV